MEQYIVSARKYRPSTFHSVIGQTNLTATLKNAIITQHLAHAYLFCGPRGVGKTTCARIFAKTINCSNIMENGEACNECESCVSFNELRSMNIFELDAASNNSVDDIRELIRQVMVPPQIGKYRVYIIDEVHMLSSQAFNAFLKTLEEPPKYAIFILATTEKHKIIPTIISRCQVYDFKRIQIDDTVNYLKYVASNEGVNAEIEALEVIAQKADGAMRDALSIFDQIVSFCGNNIQYKQVINILNVLDYEYYFKLIDVFLTGNVVEAFLILDNIINKGFDLLHFISGLSTHIRDLLLAKNPKSLNILQVSNSIREQYAKQANSCTSEFIFDALDLASQCELNYKLSKNKRLLVELTLIKICQLTSSEKKKPENNTTIKKIEVEETANPNVNAKIETVPNNQKGDKISNSSDTDLIQQKNLVAKQTNNSSINIASILKETRENIPPNNNVTNIDINKVDNNIKAQNDFTEIDLQRAWIECYSQFDDSSFFAKYFQSIKPQKIGSDCVISVINGQQELEFQQKQNIIETFLKEKLNNKEINLVIKKQNIEVAKTLSPQEILNQMTIENDKIQVFIQKLNLDIKY